LKQFIISQLRIDILPFFICPISLQIMRDPVLCSDGYSYERGAIEHWLRSCNRSPVTNQPVEQAQLPPNHVLRAVIEVHLNA
jgi:hypothetical protein